MRTIDLQIENEYVKGAGVAVGAAGSHHDVILRMTFGSMWDGTTKKIVWLDANGENPVETILTVDMRENSDDDSVYLVPIPSEPKAVAGKMMMSVRGVTVSDDVETSATLTAIAYFIVFDSVNDSNAESSPDITPTQAEQIQAEIEMIFAKWDSLTVTAEKGEEASAVAAVTDSAVQFHFVLPKGDKGDTGATGPQGEKGDKGDTGAVGPQGAKGDKGETGTTGADGLTPHIGTNYNWWIGTIDTGISALGEKGDKGDTGAIGMQGENGRDGKDGYTPVKGVDYWTAADKAEIKSYVDDAILGGEW